MGYLNFTDQVVEEFKAAEVKPVKEEGWRATIFDFSSDVAEPDPVINCCGVMVASRGNIVIITGKPKACKTTFQSVLIAACLTGHTILNVAAPRPFRVVLADTEQSRYHLSKQIDRVFRLAGMTKENRDEFTVLNLRPFSPAERYKYIMDAVEDLAPDVVFIDGCSDLIDDTNDLKQSEQLVAGLLTMSEQHNCAIVGIVHTNPTSDAKIRGHIGSTLERKCESTILLERDGMENAIKVRSKEARNRPFDSFSFALNETGDPELLSKENAPKSGVDWLIILMSPGQVYRHGELVKMLLSKGINENNAKFFITQAYKKDYIIKDKEGYRLKLASGTPDGEG